MSNEWMVRCKIDGSMPMSCDHNPHYHGEVWRLWTVSISADTLPKAGLCCKDWHRSKDGGMTRPDGDDCCVHGLVHDGARLAQEWRDRWRTAGRVFANGLALDLPAATYDRLVKGANRLDITLGSTVHLDGPPHRSCPGPAGCLCWCPGCVVSS